MVKQCIFCSQNVKEIDYRDVATMRRFISAVGKIIDPRHTGVCAKHQRQLSRSIKRARTLALLPFLKQ